MKCVAFAALVLGCMSITTVSAQVMGEDAPASSAQETSDDILKAYMTMICVQGKIEAERSIGVTVLTSDEEKYKRECEPEVIKFMALYTYQKEKDLEERRLQKERKIEEEQREARSNYFATVFKLIKSRLHAGPELHVDLARKHGVVDFYVDKDGNLAGHKLISSSGSPDLDLAVMAAIKAAAPYPTPPNSSPIYLSYNFGRR